MAIYTRKQVARIANAARQEALSAEEKAEIASAAGRAAWADKSPEERSRIMRARAKKRAAKRAK